MAISLGQLARHLNATLHGDADAAVERCAPIDAAGPEDLAFIANTKYVPHLTSTRAGAVLIGRDIPPPPACNCLIADEPYFAYRNAMVLLHGFREHPPPMDAPPGRHHSPRAAIHPEARLADSAQVHPFVTIERGARIGARTVLYPGVSIGEHAVVGEDCILYPNVVVYDRCRLGDRITLHAGVVIGQDGFGYATHADDRGEVAHHKIPQHGIVVVEDDVELGGGCMIERAAMGETRIGAGTKMADLISIGHNTTIGRHCLLVSLVGVSGSVQMGDYVVLGGQVGVTGHLSIGDGVQAMARSAIARDVPAGMKIGGAPAVPYQQAKRNALAATELYELFRRVRALERQVQGGRELDARRASAGNGGTEAGQGDEA